jgi:hypothetical protein
MNLSRKGRSGNALLENATFSVIVIFGVQILAGAEF